MKSYVFGHRWSHLGETSPQSISGTDSPIHVKTSSLNILGTDGPIRVKKINSKYLGTDGLIRVKKKSSLNISGTDSPTWVKADKQAKKNKSNKNIYKQKQTIEKTGESNKLPKYAQ